MSNLLVERHKYRGRTLHRAVPELGLKKNDRLEPSEHLMIVFEFEQQIVPFDVLFFVGGTDDRVIHRSPMALLPKSIELWAIDILHTWHQGPLSTAISWLIRLMLKTQVWKPAVRFLEAEDESRLSLLALKSELWAHYRCAKAQDATWQKRHSEVTGINIKV